MHQRLSSRFCATAFVCAAIFSALPTAYAANAGAFAIKGIGATDCAIAVREYTAGTPNAMMYGGWIYGYLTAINQVSPDTFDLAPWQDLNTLTNFVVEFCKKNPKTPFAQATFKMAVALNPQRQKTRTDYIHFPVNGKGYTMYAATIQLVSSRLTAKGFLKPKAASQKPEFTADMIAGIKAFQTSRKLKPTGEPDQQTLFELLQR